MPTFYFHRLTRRAAAFAAILLALSLVAGSAFASTQPDIPENLGRGLGPLVHEYVARRQAGQSETESARAALAKSVRAQTDGKNRVLVDVVLDGNAPLAQVQRRTESLGGAITASIDWYRHGIFTAMIPLREAADVARIRGVSAVHLASGHHQRIGAATSQGTVVLNTALVNTSGYLGAGITVGVVSDSYNTDQEDASDPGWTTAQNDIATGDLPGPGTPNGYTTPVDVLQDGASYYTDEGRAMLQIIHDVAPAANLAFCTSGTSDAQMAANIARLQNTAHCQVICDDTGFYDEPMFSDGVIAQAINRAAAAGVAYFSAIGNDGNSGYQAVFNPVSNSQGRSQATIEGINLSSIPTAESNVIYEWHGFGTDTSGNPIVVQNITTGAYSPTLIFQWDDPFDVTNGGIKGITCDYDILVFNSSGNYQSSLSGVENNITSNEPIELPDGYMSASTPYKICIVLTTRVNSSNPRAATHLRYLITDDYDVITGDDINLNNVSAQGHAYAAGSAGVAAWDYDDAPPPTPSSSHVYTPLIEGYSSNGPIDIYFDSAGNRLTAPLVRKQPMFAATDNVDTTFFPPYPTSPNPNDYDNDGWPNFAGTSAATPHAAGIAALLMNAAAVNNLGTLSPQEIQSLMIATTQGITDQDPLFCSGTAGPITITDTGDGQVLPNVFEIAFTGSTGTSLTSVTINLLPVKMVFDPSSTDANGDPWTLVGTTGSPAPTAGSRSYGGTPSKSTLTMAFTNFGRGDTLSFGVGFDDSDTLNYGYDADELGGATFSVTVSGVTYNGTFQNSLSRTYNYKSGFGLLDANAALNLLLSQ